MVGIASVLNCQKFGIVVVLHLWYINDSLNFTAQINYEGGY